MANLERNLTTLATRQYDIVIVGGGIFGVCAAWEAASRGLSVAIIEKADFCHATSANHFKMVHGGIRYMQHGDIYRLRESSHERSALLRVAPHLVHPLPIVMPTYGHGLKGKELLGVGMLVYDLLTMDRNRGLINDRRIPGGRFISRREVMNEFPGINGEGLTGGALFCDGQMYNPPRLVISFLRSAVDSGTDAANYMEATGFVREGNRILGVEAVDTLSGTKLEIRGKMVLNTAGPWAHHLLESGLDLRLTPRPTFSRDLAFVINRRAVSRWAIAFPTKTQDNDSFINRGGRHLFAVPWRGKTLIGVWHRVFPDLPEKISVTRKELQSYINEVNEANPSLALTVDDITMVNTGLTLFGDENKQDLENMSFGKRSRLIDHGRENHLEGLVTLIGVRFTVARGMAEKAINMILKKLGKKSPPSRSSYSAIYGGEIDCFEEFLQQSAESSNNDFEPALFESLIHNYGSQYRRVLKYIDENPAWSETVGSSNVIKAEVIHAVREEMAQKLTDVVFRRTDLGTAGHPGIDTIQSCADLMASELKWDSDRKEKEIAEISDSFPSFSDA